ncbi:MAG: superoxide dismutase [Anaerolineaceae bacterium]|nr:superoxide dismutase [Anaerolineaceae bacterium]
MKILAIEKDKPGITHDQLEPFLDEESRRAWELLQDGILRELYFRADFPGAVLVMEAATLEEAQKAIDTLPLVREGLVDFDWIPLAPYSGFARLFAGTD